MVSTIHLICPVFRAVVRLYDDWANNVILLCSRITQLSYDLRTATLYALLHLQLVCAGLAVLVQVRLGLEGKTTRITSEGSFIRMCAYMLLQNTWLGTH